MRSQSTVLGALAVGSPSEDRVRALLALFRTFRADLRIGVAMTGLWWEPSSLGLRFQNVLPQHFFLAGLLSLSFIIPLILRHAL